MQYFHMFHMKNLKANRLIFLNLPMLDAIIRVARNLKDMAIKIQSARFNNYLEKKHIYNNSSLHFEFHS